MIVSLLYHLTRGLLSVSAVLLRGDTAKDAELLVMTHENAIRRRRRAAIFSDHASNVAVLASAPHCQQKGTTPEEVGHPAGHRHEP